MRRILEWGRKLLTLNGSPRGVALGFALGLGLSCFPIPFAGMVLALALAPVVRANPAATYLGTAVVNPITGPAIYFGELWLGATVLGETIPRWSTLAGLDGWAWWDLFTTMLAPFGVGAALVMLGSFVVSFPVVRVIVARWGSTRASGTSGSG